MSIVKKDLTCQWVMPREFSSLTPLSALRKTFRSCYLLDLSLFEDEASFEAECERALLKSEVFVRTQICEILKLYLEEGCGWFCIRLKKSEQERSGSEILVKIVCYDSSLIWCHKNHRGIPMVFALCCKLPGNDIWFGSEMDKTRSKLEYMREMTDKGRQKKGDRLGMIDVNNHFELKMILHHFFNNSANLSNELKNELASQKPSWWPAKSTCRSDFFVSYLKPLPMCIELHALLDSNCWECGQKASLQCEYCKIAKYCSSPCKKIGE